jgi:hypothetical protein
MLRSIGSTSSAPAASTSTTLRVEQAATLAGVDDVAGPDRAAAHTPMISRSPHRRASSTPMSTPTPRMGLVRKSARSARWPVVVVENQDPAAARSQAGPGGEATGWMIKAVSQASLCTARQRNGIECARLAGQPLPVPAVAVRRARSCAWLGADGGWGRQTFVSGNHPSRTCGDAPPLSQRARASVEAGLE